MALMCASIQMDFKVYYSMPAWRQAYEQGGIIGIHAHRLKKRGGRKMVLAPEGKAPLAAQNASIDTTLVKALVRAHLWQRQLKSGKCSGMKELCERYDVTAKYVQLILRLNFLAPKLKEAILLGHQPRHMKLADLMQNIPSLWHEQGELFGCEVV